MENRTLRILEIIVDEYIRTGEPIGSKAVQELLEIPVSTATIRNEMAYLEQQGLLEHPHTSAGRVPTYNGFRAYIEKIMPHDLSDNEKVEIDEFFNELDGNSYDEIICNASKALAEFTKCAIVSTNETSKFSIISKVEVIPTGKRMYLILLITSGGNVKNRVCRLSIDLSDEQIAFFKRFAEDNLSGHNLENISDEYINRISEALGGYMMTLSPLLKGIADISSEMLKKDVNIEGEANLIACEDLKGSEIAEVLQRKSEFTKFIDNTFSGINVMFGKENDSLVISNSSMITGSFSKDGEKAGSLGLIGPMRLNYKKVIPYIEYFTSKITNMLSEDTENEELLDIEKEVKGFGEDN